MKRITVDLPNDMKRRIEQIARHDSRPQTAIIREALAAALDSRTLPPRAPLFDTGWDDPTIADRLDEILQESGSSTIGDNRTAPLPPTDA